MINIDPHIYGTRKMGNGSWDIRYGRRLHKNTKTINDHMGYQEWINRERKIRTKLIVQFRAANDTHKIRLCVDCREVVLCYENICPNCASTKISRETIDDRNLEKMIADRIHCRDRYQKLFAKKCWTARLSECIKFQIKHSHLLNKNNRSPAPACSIRTALKMSEGRGSG